jgi:hypothetical protein
LIGASGGLLRIVGLLLLAWIATNMVSHVRTSGMNPK